MGLHGHVACSCWQNGLTTPTPTDIKELILLDENGELQLLNLDETDIASKINLYERFLDWKTNACKHTDMLKESIYLGNYGSLNILSNPLAQAGWSRFSTLTDFIKSDTIPNSTTPETSQKLLDDLTLLTRDDPSLKENETISDFQRLLIASTETGNNIVWT